MTELDTRADIDSVATLLRPRSVAVVGASADGTRIGGLILRLLVRHGFSGPIYPINPKYTEIEGMPCYPSLADLPDDAHVDVAVVYLAAAQAIDVIRSAGERGVKGVVVISSGFAEIGDYALQDELTSVANDFGIAVAGPNCAGLANFNADFVAYGTTNFIDLQFIRRGGVAVLTASGGLGNTIFTYLQERGVGLSHLIGLGNEAVTTSASYVDALVDDPETSVIVGNLEAVRQPAEFFAAAARAATAGKPMVVLKGGRSEAGRAAIITHTAALGGTPEAFAAQFARHGVIQVHDLHELADTAMLLTQTPRFSGERVGVLSLAGGGTGLVSDLASDHDFTLPEFADETIVALRGILPDLAIAKNPVDPTAGFGRQSEKLRASLRILAADPNVDVVVFFPLASQVDYAQQLADDVIVVANEIDKPLIVIWTAGRQLETGAWRTLHEAGVPLFIRTGDAFRALAHTRDYARFIERQALRPSNDFGRCRGVALPTAIPACMGPLDPEWVRNTLFYFGIRHPECVNAATAGEAAAAVARIGRSVLKVASPDVAHKSDVGGVVLGVEDADAAHVAFESIVGNVAQNCPDARVSGVEVHEMVPRGVELLLGISNDDQLGQILTVGLGGILTEVLADVVQLPLPVSRSDATDMVARLRGARLLDGYRGEPKVDVDAVVDAILGLCAFAEALRDYRPEIDINPLIALPNAAIAVDALVILSGQ